MALHEPVWKFYETYEDFVLGVDVLTISGDTWFQQITGARLVVDRFGGDVEGELDTIYYLATHLRIGWFFRYYPNAAVNPYYSGVIENIKYRGRVSATIQTVGVINRMNNTPDYTTLIFQSTIREVVSALVDISRDYRSALPVDVVSEELGNIDDDIFAVTGTVLDWNWFPGNTLVSQLRLVEAMTTKFAYGIAGDVGLLNAEGTTITDSTFFSVWGDPPLRRWFVEDLDYILISLDEKWSNITNEIVLRFERKSDRNIQEYILRDGGSIDLYGIRSSVVNTWEMTATEANDFQNLILNRYAAPATRWEVELIHDDVEGATNNFIESSPPWPWHELLGLKDAHGAMVLDRAEVQQVIIVLDGKKLKFRVIAGEDRSDLAELSLASQISTNHEPIGGIGTGTGSSATPIGGCPERYHPSASFDIDGIEPPLAIPGDLIDPSLYDDSNAVIVSQPTGVAFTDPFSGFTRNYDTLLNPEVYSTKYNTDRTWGWVDDDSFVNFTYKHLFWNDYLKEYYSSTSNFLHSFQVHRAEGDVVWTFTGKAFFKLVHDNLFRVYDIKRNTSVHVNWADDRCRYRYKYIDHGFVSIKGMGEQRETRKQTGYLWGYDITSGGVDNPFDARKRKDVLHAGLQFHLGGHLRWDSPTPTGTEAWCDDTQLSDLHAIYNAFGTDNIFIVRAVRKPYTVNVDAAALPGNVSGITEAGIQNSVFYLTDLGKARAESLGYILAVSYEFSSGGAGDVTNDTHSYLSPYPSRGANGAILYETVDRYRDVGQAVPKVFIDALRSVSRSHPGSEYQQDGTVFKRGSTRVYMKRKLVQINLQAPANTAITLIQNSDFVRQYEYRVRGFDDLL